MTKTSITTVAATLLLAVTASADCGLSGVCEDVGASITIDVESDGIRLEWSTDDESGISHYKISRRNCGSQQCVVQVATVYPRGTCSENEEYEYHDNPPDPDSQWIYKIEVFGAGSGLPACAFEVAGK